MEYNPREWKVWLEFTRRELQALSVLMVLFALAIGLNCPLSIITSFLLLIQSMRKQRNSALNLKRTMTTAGAGMQSAVLSGMVIRSNPRNVGHTHRLIARVGL
jgi:hypothetical protein